MTKLLHHKFVCLFCVSAALIMFSPTVSAQKEVRPTIAWMLNDSAWNSKRLVRMTDKITLSVVSVDEKGRILPAEEDILLFVDEILIYKYENSARTKLVTLKNIQKEGTTSFDFTLSDFRPENVLSESIDYYKNNPHAVDFCYYMELGIVYLAKNSKTKKRFYVGTREGMMKLVPEKMVTD